jgi:hypothetical protein
VSAPAGICYECPLERTEATGWTMKAKPMRHVLQCSGTILLAFSQPDEKGDPVRGHLSSVLASPDGRTLWLTSDETASVERLTLSETGTEFGAHVRFDLRPLLDLPGGGTQEADIEGLGLVDGHLWVVGSHSLARRKPEPDTTAEAMLARLEDVKREANRFLLGRLPLGAGENGGPEPHREVGPLHASRLAIADKKKKLEKAETRSALTSLFADDVHFGPFLEVPAKDNGFDIEGMVVDGTRVFLGMRGPVLRGWATILEIAVKAPKHGPMEIVPLASGERYRKHFLDLDGLGVRCLLARGEDLWILAGPTMDLDGPVRLFAWRDALKSTLEGSSVIADVDYLGDLPHGDGVDHAEGMALVRFPGTHVDRLLVVYDTPKRERLHGHHGVRADLFAVPPSPAQGEKSGAS